MSTDYIVFRNIEEFSRFVENMVKELTEVESILKKSAPKGELINAIDAESMVNVGLDSKELLNIVHEAKEAYLKILKSIPAEIKDVEWVTVLELMGNKPVKAYIIPIILST
ncbi:hypothetical protein [Caldivirga sp. UBA161]|uniref:hypothetical protein n=1 Tax=Caldivirga sp. UBA161 TaxID=1915569 RepID=UPI0025C01425|nr:hypothetical protein [Caldivirga sp. UBA161]